MNAKPIIVAVFLAAVGGIVAVSLRKPDKDDGGGVPAVSAAVASSALPPNAPSVAITMLYGSEKKDWLEAAAVPFRKEHPEIKLDLVAKGSLAAAQALVDDKDKPTVFSPADSMVLNLAISDWRAKGRGDLFATSGDDAPQSLVITPLVNSPRNAPPESPESSSGSVYIRSPGVVPERSDVR